MLPQDAFGQGVYGQPGLKVCGCHPKGLDKGHYISVIIYQQKDLRIRKGTGTDTAWTGKYVPPGVYTIVEVKAGKGFETGWGKLKSGAGWIALPYAKRV